MGLCRADMAAVSIYGTGLATVDLPELCAW